MFSLYASLSRSRSHTSRSLASKISLSLTSNFSRIYHCNQIFQLLPSSPLVMSGEAAAKSQKSIDRSIAAWLVLRPGMPRFRLSSRLGSKEDRWNQDNFGTHGLLTVTRSLGGGCGSRRKGVLVGVLGWVVSFHTQHTHTHGGGGSRWSFVRVSRASHATRRSR